MPTYPGQFDGEMLHSHDVKSKEQLNGKRVLVVGAGNSAVDILDDAASESVRAVHSMRRSYYFFPKIVFGKPTDTFIDLTSRWPLPRAVMRKFYRWGLRVDHRLASPLRLARAGPQICSRRIPPPAPSISTTSCMGAS